MIWACIGCCKLAFISWTPTAVAKYAEALEITRAFVIASSHEQLQEYAILVCIAACRISKGHLQALSRCAMSNITRMNLPICG